MRSSRSGTCIRNEDGPCFLKRQKAVSAGELSRRPAGTASGRAEEGPGENETPPSHFTLQQAASESAGNFVGEALDQFFVEVLHDDDVRELSGTGHAAAMHDLLARAAEIDRVRPRVRMRFDAARGEGGKERFHGAMVPKIRSPASPSPGTIYLFSSSRSSRLPV